MSKNIVIVESPAKAKTIEKYLGKDFKVFSSFGHIADLPKKDMGIDISNNFQPKYEVSADKKEVVKKLKEEVKNAEWVWLASDEDREGEAIAWHLFNQLNLKKDNTKRIVFHEITKNAILKAIENPRSIDENLVNAQQARRVLDRIVGFEMSPILWKKIKTGLSAGRVQSVAVRLIVEREREIQQFKPQISYKVSGNFITANKKSIKATLHKELSELTNAQQFIENCKGKTFSVASVETKPAKRSPSAPFTTSTLQQEAARKLGMSVSRTMRLAQQLYEAGHITYMRTDSVNLSQEALSAAKETIIKNFGEKYSKIRKFTTKSKNAQEAHEAIRPTNFNVQNPTNDAAQNRLYQLVWKRALASQMSEAELEKTQINITQNAIQEYFVARGEVIIFDGFLKLYQESQDEESEDDDESLLPKVQQGENLQYTEISAVEKHSKPNARYSEASLVKKLEELGIGRPSTYAPTLTTIQSREYVQIKDKEPSTRKIYKIILKKNDISQIKETEYFGAEKRKFFPTDTGSIVNDFLTEHFTEILDFGFTAKVEEEFDDIAEGKIQWTQMMKDFYGNFHPKIEEVSENAERAKGERLLGKDPKSGRNVYVKLGRFGAMVQIGDAEDTDKPVFASLLATQTLNEITLQQALQLFELPKVIGNYQDKEVTLGAGRFGPYVKFDDKFISIPKGEEINAVTLQRAIELIDSKLKADAPIASYKGKEVIKGKGRFGPFIKWNDIFINVNKKYDFDNLSSNDVAELIEDKLKKESEKVVQNWEKENIRIEKARWGRHNLISGKIKIELAKEIDVQKITLPKAQEIIQSQKSKSKK